MILETERSKSFQNTDCLKTEKSRLPLVAVTGIFALLHVVFRAQIVDIVGGVWPVWNSKIF